MPCTRPMLAAVLALSAVLGGCHWEEDSPPVDGSNGGPIVDSGWVFLGERHVDKAQDSDTIRVNSSEKYRTLRVEVDNGGVVITRFVVRLRSGSQFTPDLGTMRAGEAREVDLPGDARTISAVDFTYTNTGKHRALLRVFGR